MTRYVPLARIRLFSIEMIWAERERGEIYVQPSLNWCFHRSRTSLLLLALPALFKVNWNQLQFCVAFEKEAQSLGMEEKEEEKTKEKKRRKLNIGIETRKYKGKSNEKKKLNEVKILHDKDSFCMTIRKSKKKKKEIYERRKAQEKKCTVKPFY